MRSLVPIRYEGSAYLQNTRFQAFEGLLYQARQSRQTEPVISAKPIAFAA
jgi:hypothetical protein